MDKGKKIRCERAELFPGCRELIQRSEKTTADALTWIENQIASKELLLYRVFENSNPIGIFTGVVERERGEPSNFHVVNAVKSGGRSKTFLTDIAPVIEDLVKRSGLKSWSVRSQRPGMGRKLEKYGFEKIETVYKRAI